jgi:hypothetical protein
MTQAFLVLARRKFKSNEAFRKLYGTVQSPGTLAGEQQNRTMHPVKGRKGQAPGEKETHSRF